MTDSHPPILATALAAVLIMCLPGCGDRARQTGAAWPSSVEAEIDDLTGARTGMFRTYGPTQRLTAGRDTIPVTVGYWCRLNEDTEPATATDGMFFRIAMPDTTLLSNDEEAFEELSGQLGLLDVARLAVDGRLYAWQYAPTSTLGGWLLDGTMGFGPHDEFDTEEERSALLAGISDLYDRLPTVGLSAYPGVHGRILNVVQDAREQWPIAHDYVTSHYLGRDTLGIELKGVLKFPIEGLDAAADSVRFWCPIPQAHHEWNDARRQFFAALDSLRTIEDERAAEVVRRIEAQQARIEAQQARREAQQAEEQRIAEARRRALDSIRRFEERQLASIQTLLPELLDHRARALLAYARANGVEVLNQQGLQRVCDIWRGSDRPVDPITRVAMNEAC